MMRRHIANAVSRAQEIGPKISHASILLTKKPEEPKVVQPPVQIGVPQQQVALIQQQAAVADAQRIQVQQALDVERISRQKLEQELEDSKRAREILEQTNAQLTSQLDAYEAAHRQISTPSSNGSPAKQSPLSTNRKASMPPSSPAGSERFRLPNAVHDNVQESPKRGSPNIVETKQEAELDKLSVSSNGSNSIIPDFKELTSPEFGKMIQKLKSEFPTAADDEASVMSSPVLVSTPKGSNSGSDDAFTVLSPPEPKKEGKRYTKS